MCVQTVFLNTEYLFFNITRFDLSHYLSYARIKNYSLLGEYYFKRNFLCLILFSIFCMKYINSRLKERAMLSYICYFNSNNTLNHIFVILIWGNSCLRRVQSRLYVHKYHRIERNRELRGDNKK